ncbi:hypothetical protein [Chryseobacterium sp. Mn2064]|uniref:hypothetical protein n=1 Tax=Chryseobacterium sp. Mn2064 TaxID=3395263 RepID=UPI003BC71A35
MKIKLIVGIISLFSVLSFGQTKKVDYEAGIKRDFTSFFKNIKDRNIEKAVDFIYPRYLNITDRQQMVIVLNLSYNNPILITDVQELKINHIEKPELIDGEYFSVTDYTLDMKLKVDWKVINDPEAARPMINDKIITQYGKDHVAYFSDGDYYSVHAQMKACAVSKNEKEWKFLLVEENNKPVNILPQKVLDKF